MDTIRIYSQSLADRNRHPGLGNSIDLDVSSYLGDNWKRMAVWDRIRPSYRRMRRAGMTPFMARTVVFDMLFAAHLSSGSEFLSHEQRQVADQLDALDKAAS